MKASNSSDGGGISRAKEKFAVVVGGGGCQVAATNPCNTEIHKHSFSMQEASRREQTA
jgi:hypothetical protein